ncbi:hypothetical protein [Desulfotalea psychrophila]|nr:hypothetical protein [Desulfotalea psychrophila]
MQRKIVSAKTFGSSCLFICLSSFLITPAFAKTDITTSIEVETQYDSNFWMSENNEISTMTYTIRPGIEAVYDTGKTKITGMAVLEGYIYDNLDSRPTGVKSASDDNYLGYLAFLSLSSQVTDRFAINGYDRIHYTRDSAQADKLSNSTDREKFLINDFEMFGIMNLAKNFRP